MSRTDVPTRRPPAARRRLLVAPLTALFGLLLLGTAVSASAPAVGWSTPGWSAAGSVTATDLSAPTNTAPLTGVQVPEGFTLPKLVNVRTGRHAAYDRTVFDFVGGTPGYRVEYGTLREGGTGNPVPVAGAATLVVTFHNAFAHDVETGAPTYDIGRTLEVRLPTLRQIRFGEDFEGVVTAGLGLADRVGFRVLRLHQPDRIAVDVAHQPSQSFGTSTVWVGDAGLDTSVRGMRSGRHPGYDRLVFDLDTAGVPLVFVAYRQQTSTVVVGFSGRNVPAVFAGPRTVHFGHPQLRSARVVNYGNGTVTVFVDTKRRHGFRVMVLANPTRLVVDVAH